MIQASADILLLGERDGPHLPRPVEHILEQVMVGFLEARKIKGACGAVLVEESVPLPGQRRLDMLQIDRVCQA